MRPGLLFVVSVFIGSGFAVATDPARFAGLTEAEIAEGWLMLFDRESTFGWEARGQTRVEGGRLILGGGAEEATLTTTAAFGPGRLVVDTVSDRATGVRVEWIGEPKTTSSDGKYVLETVAGNGCEPRPIRLTVPAARVAELVAVRYLPHGLAPMLNNRDLTGWKVYDADPAKAQARFEVTAAGELHAIGGPGDLQSETRFADFLLQVRAKTNGHLVNSGVFFRCVPGEFQRGYEAQIQNAYFLDRSRPLDGGTGAIYRRVPARKVVSTDREWFTLTVLAVGPHLATWVNGYQTADWTDPREPNDNPRVGRRTSAGHISIQGHAPPFAADVLYSDIRIADWGKPRAGE